MVNARRFANQVHKQAARLMRGGGMDKEPKWYQSVLAFPPLPLPGKMPATRSAFDAKPRDVDAFYSNRSKQQPNTTPHPLTIYYLEDDIRRQFFRDHPFETFRPTTLVEGKRIAAPNPVTGKMWTRLRQRGHNPRAEDAVQFALNLYVHHDLPLSEAYRRSVAQFRALRGERQTAVQVAALEARSLGAIFGHSEIEHVFEKMKRGLAGWQRAAAVDEGEMAARKRWKAVADRYEGTVEWTRGEKYVRLWRDGVRPTYSPAISQPTSALGIAPPTAADAAQASTAPTADYVSMLPQRA
ncbi:mitochondrial ribosomal protein S25-domain-containing protein [Schizophyllum commune]